MKKPLLLRTWIVMALLVMLSTSIASGQATLKHSYTFDDGATDVVGGADGTVVGSAISIADGKCTVSGATTNTDGYITFDPAAIQLNTYSAVTLEAMVETGETLNSTFTMLAYFGTETQGSNCFWIQPTRSATETRIEANNGSTTVTALLSGYEVDDGLKHHIVAILSSTAITYYLDGQIIAETSTDGADYISTLMVGENPIAQLFKGPNNWPDPNYNCSLEEFNIYDGVLDEATINQHLGDFLGDDFFNAKLSDLTATPGEMDPVYAEGTQFYELWVPYGTTTVNIDATPQINGASVLMYDGLGNEIVDGEVAFSGDGIDVEIIVVALDGSTEQTYYLSIYLNPSTEAATLQAIDLSAGTLTTEFIPDSLNYVAIVPYGTTSVDVTGVKTWDGATMTGGGAVTLTDGMGSTTITVTSEDGENTLTYNVDVYESNFSTGNFYYLVNDPSGFVIEESGNSYNQIVLGFPTKDKEAQLFEFIESGEAGQYFIKNQVGNYVVLAPQVGDQVWDIIMQPSLTVNLDSSRFVFNEFEPGRYRIDAVARLNTSNYHLGPNNPPSIGGGVFSDKWDSDNNAIWNVEFPEDVVDPVDTYLDTIYIDGVSLNPDFVFYTQEYFVVLPEGTASIDLVATANEPTNTVSGTGTIDVSAGSGAITITVTSADEQYSRDYTVNYLVETALTLKHSYTFADGTGEDMAGDLDANVRGGSITDGVFTSAQGGDYMTLDPVALALNQYSAITLEAYVTQGANPGWTMLAYFGNTFGDYSYWMSIARNDNVSKTAVDLVGSAEVGPTGVEPAEGENHHFVSVLTYDTLYWYMDGTLAGKTALPANYLISDISDYGAWIGYGGYNDPTWLGDMYEFNIYEGQMDAATVAARAVAWPAEDSTSDATLSDLTINGETIDGFVSYMLDYTIELEPGTTDIPALVATTKVSTASAVVTDASELPGTATVVVTAEDGTENTYTINFEVVFSDDATLSDLTVDGTTVSGFAPGTLSYVVSLPEGATTVPTVVAVTNHAGATAVVNAASELPGTTTVVVTAQDGTTEVTYEVVFTVAVSNDATLSGITYNGTALDGFDAATYNYQVTLPYGTTAVPTVVGTSTDANATVEVTDAASLPGTTTIKVTAEDEITVLNYSIYFDVDPDAVELHGGIKVKVYPSVSKDRFTVESVSGMNIVTVYDITGKVVHKQMSEDAIQTFTVQNEGMYIVKVEVNGQSTSFKVFKTK